jgi:hypothetical protein
MNSRRSGKVKGPERLATAFCKRAEGRKSPAAARLGQIYGSAASLKIMFL